MKHHSLAESSAHPGDLLDVEARCPRCGTAADLQVSELLADLLAGIDPRIRVGTYRCHSCATVYDLFAEAYTADLARDANDADASRKGVRNGVATPADATAVLESLIGSIAAPSDFAAEHDHYLYGSPKRAGQ